MEHCNYWNTKLRKRRIQTKPKNPQKNAREKKRVEAVATAQRQLRTELGAGDDRRTTKVETLQTLISLCTQLVVSIVSIVYFKLFLVMQL